MDNFVSRGELLIPLLLFAQIPTSPSALAPSLTPTTIGPTSTPSSPSASPITFVIVPTSSYGPNETQVYENLR